MIIYGTALLSICLLLGLTIGRMLGNLAGIDADIGGVGISMLLLIISCDYLQRSGRMKPPTEAGIAFLGSIYIPIVVAMAASQNVLAALQGGAVALLAGTLTVGASFALVVFFVKAGSSNSPAKG